MTYTQLINEILNNLQTTWIKQIDDHFLDYANSMPYGRRDVTIALIDAFSTVAYDHCDDLDFADEEGE